jgi:hypothetical protein
VTYKEFLAAVAAAYSKINRGSHGHDVEYWEKEGSIEIEWCVGGMTGGSYNGRSADEPISADPEPNFEHLEVLLAMIWPDITYLKYRELERSMITLEERTSNDYYGNYSKYAVKKVDLKKLWEFIHDYIDKTLLEPK